MVVANPDAGVNRVDLPVTGLGKLDGLHPRGAWVWLCGARPVSLRESVRGRCPSDKWHVAESTAHSKNIESTETMSLRAPTRPNARCVIARRDQLVMSGAGS
jgi:hypothetical protein